jgi:hypothetical protein
MADAVFAAIVGIGNDGRPGRQFTLRADRAGLARLGGVRLAGHAIQGVITVADGLRTPSPLSPRQLPARIGCGRLLQVGGASQACNQLIEQSWQFGERMPITGGMRFRRQHLDQAELRFDVVLTQRVVEQQITDLL